MSVSSLHEIKSGENKRPANNFTVTKQCPSFFFLLIYKMEKFMSNKMAHQILKAYIYQDKRDTKHIWGN